MTANQIPTKLPLTRHLAMLARGGPLRWRFKRKRAKLARRFLRGGGIEVGALHLPLEVPQEAEVRYVDRWPSEELRTRHPDVDVENIVPTDILDDGERLATISDASQDFVIANHFLEHCEDPIGALANMLRVLKEGGVAYLAVPDKRFIPQDLRRPRTPLAHVLQDHAAGPEGSRLHHFEEWARIVENVPEDEIAARVDELIAEEVSIHFHVWTRRDALELLSTLGDRLGFEVEASETNGHENIFILSRRKAASQTVPDEVYRAPAV
jgi:SAM-dependent methyltransferase